MLVVAPIVVGIIGVIAERLIIRVLYGRMIDTLLATWGLSLFFVGLVTTIFGNTVAGIGGPPRQRRGRAATASACTAWCSSPSRRRSWWPSSTSCCRRPGSACSPAARWRIANMAAALGVSPPRVYATTFGVGPP